ncbi:hypothetical protein [Paraburkholderia sp. GAS82]|uniref:hypothetical protein n=1 Tax=Paraburkholderia sp. GAS82 TaxID=3035137 RepID=UPI003D239357
MNEGKTCHGGCGNGCEHCGMDIDLEPYCVQEEVLKRRTAITGRTYPFGLDVNPARQLCKGEFYIERTAKDKP